MHNDLKQQVLNANKWIVEKKLVELTWGNVSSLDSCKEKIYIKPSGVDLYSAKSDDIAVVDRSGTSISGLKPSVDTPTHLALYRGFKDLMCVVHVHSKYSTIFAQAGLDIPCLGTTHADYFYGDIPCVPHPSIEEVRGEYEMNTGNLIVEHYRKNNINYCHIPACVVSGHGAFIWGENINDTLERAFVLEVVAEMAFKTRMMNPQASLEKYVLDKHYLRKHGNKKYYGQ